MRRVTDDRALWLCRHVLPHEAELRAWLRRRNVPGLDIDDVVQETYARLAGLESVADVRDPRTYAFQAAHSVILTHLRRSRIVPIQPAANIEELAGSMAEISPERQLEGIEELRRLSEVIGSLPERCREVFILRRIDGLSQREVALRLGVSEKTIEKHMARGIRLLMDVFGRGGKAPARLAERLDSETQVEHGKPATG